MPAALGTESRWRFLVHALRGSLTGRRPHTASLLCLSLSRMQQLSCAESNVLQAARKSDSRHGGDLREPSRIHAEHHGGGEMSRDVWEQWQRAGFVPAPAATLNSKHGSKTRDAAPTSHPTSKDVDVTERDQGASDVSKPSLNSKVIAESPGGLVPHMDTSSTVTERGSCGVWDVAYDKSAAEETVRKLGLHWHRQEVESVKHAAADGSGDRTSGPGTTVNGGIPGHNGSQELASSALNNSCAHTACSAKVTIFKYCMQRLH